MKIFLSFVLATLISITSLNADCGMKSEDCKMNKTHCHMKRAEKKQHCDMKKSHCDMKKKDSCDYKEKSSK